MTRRQPRTRACALAAIFVLGSAACDDAEITDNTGVWVLGDAGTDTEVDAVDDTSMNTIEAAIHSEGPPVLDPKLSGFTNVQFSIEAAGEGCVPNVRITARNGQSRSLGIAANFSVSWDGRDNNGAFFDPGPARATATVECEDGHAEVSTLFHVVRLGVTAVDFTGSKSDGHVNVAYHRLDISRRGLTVLDGSIPEWVSARETSFELSDLDGPNGAPREQAELWSNPEWPPWGDSAPATPQFGAHSVPAAYVAGSRPEIVATFGEVSMSTASGVAVGASGPLGADSQPPAIRVALDGYESEDGRWSPAGDVSLRATDALPGTLGLITLDLVWRFEAEVEGAWVSIPGQQQTTHSIYLVAGTPALPDGTAQGASPPVAWLAVLDGSLDALTGIDATDEDAIMDALRDRLHLDPALLYDPGERTYCDYQGEYIYWDYIWFDMSEWLDRVSGYRMYCHSLACLLSSHANHWGLEAGYVTLAEGFQTNLTRAAGFDNWRTWSFRSHGVAGLLRDDGYVVWDAAVDIDSDDDPSSEPVTPMSPRGLPLQDYLNALTDDDIGLVNEGRCFVY